MTRKLTLRRETVQTLTDTELKRVAGGSDTAGLCASAYNCTPHTLSGCPRRISAGTDMCDGTNSC